MTSPLQWMPDQVRHDEENEVAAIPARNGLAFAGKNAIAPPDPAPDTFWRCGTLRRMIFWPEYGGNKPSLGGRASHFRRRGDKSG
jgi:hypothetical protein